MVAPVFGPTPVAVQRWRELYKAAMTDTDRETLPFRINEAKAALTHRARELFALGDNSTKERKAIDRALYTLQALSYCLKLESSDADDRRRRRAVRR